MEKEAFYANARRDLTGPLDGLVVVEATTTWAGPMAGCVLGDMGARVIKVEHPSGEVARRLPPMLPEANLTVPHETVNRNKENISVDMHSAAGRDIVLALASRADVFIENFKPGTMHNWGLGYEHIKAVKPDIVYVSISGFGQFGPLHDRVGYDPVAQNFCGWTSLNGDPAGGSTKAPTFFGDDLGGLHGALGALAALRHRDKTGEGQHIDVALTDALVYQSNGNLTSGATGVPLERWGNEFNVIVPVNIYQCTDGQVFTGVLLDTHWQRLAVELGREDLAHLTLAGRLPQRDLLNSLIADYCARRTVGAVVDRMTGMGLPATRVNTYADAAQHPHMHARDMLIPMQLANGQTVPLTGPAAKFSRTPTTIRTRAATLGEHNEQILTQLGYSPAQIAELKAHGVI